MVDLRKQYRDLEMRVLNSLREAIMKSSYESKHINTLAIKVNVYDYTELVVLNNILTFLDSDGLHYDLFSECTLEDFIDILNSEK